MTTAHCNGDYTTLSPGHAVRPRPSNQAERKICGSLLRDPNQFQRLPLDVTEEVFRDSAYRRLFKTLRAMYDDGESIDMFTVIARFKHDDPSVPFFLDGYEAHGALGQLQGDAIADSWVAAEYVVDLLNPRVSAADGPDADDDPPFLSLGELIDTYPKLRPPVIDGLLRVGETMNAISTTKVGKSWLLLDLILSVATGGKWLGTFPCTKGRVLLFDNELHRETLASRLMTVAEARKIPLEEVRRQVTIVPVRGRKVDVSQIFMLLERRGVKPGDYAMLVLDALYRALPPGTKENDNDCMMTVYNELDAIGEAYGMAISNVHHSSKGDQSQKSVTDVGSGAGSISRAADTHLILRPHEEENVAVMDVALRSFAPVESRCFRWEFPVWVPADDLSPELLASPRRKRQEKQTESRDRKSGTDLLNLLDALDPQRIGCGCSKLKNKLAWNPTKFNRVLGGLISEEVLEDFDVASGRGDGTKVDGVRRKTRTSPTEVRTDG